MFKISKGAQYLAPEDSRIFSFTVAFSDYQKYFADEQMSMRVDTIVKVAESGKSFSDFLEFQFFNSNSSVEINVSESNLKYTD